jgi:hypothetical protein
MWPLACASSISAKLLSPLMLMEDMGSIWTATRKGLGMPP